MSDETEIYLWRLSDGCLCEWKNIRLTVIVEPRPDFSLASQNSELSTELNGMLEKWENVL